MSSLIGYGQLVCKKNGAIHSILEVHDLDTTGYSQTAFKLGWLQTNTVSGRGYCCPKCHDDAWKGREEQMGR